MTTEREKMLAGELYLASDPELVQARASARDLLRQYNQTSQAELSQRAKILKRLLGAVGEQAWIEPPFYCDYGSNLFLGRGVYLNFNCTVLDCNTVHIGDNAKFGPSVQIYTAYHPVEVAARLAGPELAAPIRIGQNSWIGGGVIVCPGVTIGDNTTIGAGSVVTKDIPANVVAVGNPCRVLRSLDS